MNYRLAKNIEMVERDNGCFLVAKAPLSILRLNRPLKDLISRGLGGELAPVSVAEQGILEQLVAKGFLERLTDAAAEGAELPSVSVVIPVMDRADELGRCLASVSRLNYPQKRLQVIVVDDGSRDASARVARQFGALLVASGGRGRGPAAARNVGASVAQGDILAFIDSDCTASPDWLTELTPLFDDGRTAAVGGMVDGMCTESAVDRYEAVMSSLSLGSRTRYGGSGDDTFYLPSCNLLVRRSAFLKAGGFKDAMHVGEDVDLTWRLRDQGWTITYQPKGRVFHEHRSTINSFMARRFDYGTSEGVLQCLHPQRRKRMVVPPLLALLLSLCLVAPFTGGWSLLAALGVLLADTVIVRYRLARHNVPLGLAPLLGGRVRALASLVYYLSFHLVRYYSLLFIAAALLVPLVWLPFLAVLGCAARVDYGVKKPALSFLGFSAVYLLEHMAYGAGVFWGCLKRGTFSSYRVTIRRHMEAAV
ncbi:MAG TPA: mycofactocin biosynthesis glycosyltransferase MftF [Geobacteraceae bacterium]